MSAGPSLQQSCVRVVEEQVSAVLAFRLLPMLTLLLGLLVLVLVLRLSLLRRMCMGFATGLLVAAAVGAVVVMVAVMVVMRAVMVVVVLVVVVVMKVMVRPTAPLAIRPTTETLMRSLVQGAVVLPSTFQVVLQVCGSWRRLLLQVARNFFKPVVLGTCSA